MRKTQMKLGLSMRYLGYHDAAWRHPEVPPGGATDFKYFLNSARIAERGKFDMVFFADGIGIRANDNPPGSLARSNRNAELEPLTLLSALAASTSHIGLVADRLAPPTTSRTTSPASSPRSTIISGGRAGWNIVTSWSEQEAWNFSRDAHLDYDTRYDRATEFVDVVIGLWDSWEDGRLRPRQGGGPVLRPGQAPRAQSPRQAFLRARPAQRAAHASGPADPGAGRRVRAGPGDRRRQRRCGLRRPGRARRRQGLLRRAEGAHGQVRPRAGSPEGDARPSPPSSAARGRRRRPSSTSCRS